MRPPVEARPMDRLMNLEMEGVLGGSRFDDYGRTATTIGCYTAEVKPVWEEDFADRPPGELSTS